MFTLFLLLGTAAFFYICSSAWRVEARHAVPLKANLVILIRVPNDADITLNHLSGDWKIFQLRGGHRWNTDDLLVAWLAQQTRPVATRLLDLGSGVGSIGLLTLQCLPPAATLLAVEAQADSVLLARQSLSLNQLGGRATVRHADLRDPQAVPAGQGFDLITANPPYLPAHAATRPAHPQKAYARLELRGDVFDYCRVAAAHLAPQGALCLCHAAADPRPPEAIAAAGLVLNAFQQVVFRQGKAPTITLYQASWFGEVVSLPPLIIRDADGNWTPSYCDIRSEMGLRAEVPGWQRQR